MVYLWYSIQYISIALGYIPIQTVWYKLPQHKCILTVYSRVCLWRRLRVHQKETGVAWRTLTKIVNVHPSRRLKGSSSWNGLSFSYFIFDSFLMWRKEESSLGTVCSSCWMRERQREKHRLASVWGQEQRKPCSYYQTRDLDGVGRGGMSREELIKSRRCWNMASGKLVQ